MDVAFKLHHPRAVRPRYAHVNDSGLDLFAVEEITVRPTDGVVKIPVGVSFAIPSGHEGQIRGRSGLSLQGLDVKTGTIDASYRGEVAVIVSSSKTVTVPYGKAIAQLVVSPVTRACLREVAEHDNTTRGASGFGSTDKLPPPVGDEARSMHGLGRPS